MEAIFHRRTGTNKNAKRVAEASARPSSSRAFVSCALWKNRWLNDGRWKTLTKTSIKKARTGAWNRFISDSMSGVKRDQQPELAVWHEVINIRQSYTQWGGGGRTFLFSYDKSLNCSHSLLPPPRLFFHSVPVHNLSLPGDSYKETEVHRLPIPHTRVTLQPDFLPSFHTRTVHLVSSSHSSIASKSTYGLEKHIFSQVGQVHLLEENPQSFLNHSWGLEHKHRLLCRVLKRRILAPDFAIVSPNKIKTVFVFF